jgi:hypothetical protein
MVRVQGAEASQQQGCSMHAYSGRTTKGNPVCSCLPAGGYCTQPVCVCSYAAARTYSHLAHAACIISVHHGAPAPPWCMGRGLMAHIGCVSPAPALHTSFSTREYTHTALPHQRRADGQRVGAAAEVLRETMDAVTAEMRLWHERSLPRLRWWCLVRQPAACRSSSLSSPGC